MAKREAWCRPHERRRWMLGQGASSTGVGILYGSEGLTSICTCKAAGACPDVDPGGTGVTTFDPNQLKYSDYVAIELGFGITAEGE